MPIKTLLSFYAHENDTAALSASLEMAAQYGAHLDVLHVMRDTARETQALALSVSALHLETLAEEQEENQLAEAGLLFRTFSDMAQQKGIALVKADAQDGAFQPDKAVARWLMPQADPFQELVSQSHVHDLTVLAWHKEHREIELESLLEESARPVMLVPENYRARTLSRASILWNRSAGATHAVALSLPLLKSMEKVEIITTPEKARTPSQGLTLRQHLHAHGIEASQQEVTATNHLAEALYAACEKAGSDIIIMGAYSANTLRKKLLGGVTEALLERTAIPLLMAH